MIDKGKIKKMWVWDKDESKTKRRPRYVVIKTNSGCWAINQKDEIVFERGYRDEEITLTFYDNCEPIKEPSLNDLPDGWTDAWYRKKDKDIQEKILYISGEDSIALSYYGIVTISALRKYWQILINGEWHDCSEYLGE